MNTLAGQIVLVPNVLSEVLKSEFESPTSLLDLRKSIDLFSLGTTASFIIVNELYDPQISKNLFDALFASISKYDFMGDSFTALTDENPDQALQLRREIDAKRITMTKEQIGQFVEGGDYTLDNTVNSDDTDVVQFYVPEVFVIENFIYGVRLKATPVKNADENSRLFVERDAVEAMLTQLGKRFNNNLLTQTPLFKEFLSLSKKLGTI